MDAPQASPPPGDFKPNIYPIMYWALAFGATAGILLFILSVLARYITFVWFPVFLVGLAWGGYRNYQKQKHEWTASSGIAPATASPVDEFKQAVRDITSASRDLLSEQEPEAPSQTPPPEPTTETEDTQAPPAIPLQP